MSSVTIMTGELDFDKVFFFKLKGGAMLGDLVLAFCNWFEEENQGHWGSTEKSEIIPGKLTFVKASREWVFGGEGVALLLFYSEEGDEGRVAAYIYASDTRSIFSDRPVNGLNEQVGLFFREKCNELLELETHRETGAQEKGEEVEEPSDQEKEARGRQLTGWLTPITFCEKCGAAIAIDESTYCWNCGAELPRESTRTSTSAESLRAQPHCDEVEYDRGCMICKLRFKDGDLLAWCPHCGAPAHRIHMLEWLHVKGTCPACGWHLATPELEEQLSQAHLRVTQKSLSIQRRGVRN
jgi:predicted RNA-binding Zn-ribbon protein involved in translation (DUF1610 family)